MSRPLLEVLDAGLQTTIQAGPRRGLRHVGVPSCGPADPLSFALANRAVGNALDAPGLEVTLTGASFRALTDAVVAVTGAPCSVNMGDVSAAMHAPLAVRSGQTFKLGPATAGCRTYLAVAGGLEASVAFGSASTYLPAALGGLGGRALRPGDWLSGRDAQARDPGPTPRALRQHFGGAIALRAVIGPEAGVLDPDGLAALFCDGWRVDPASDCVGVRLAGPVLAATGDGRMDSAATFPGMVQLPPGGGPIVLGADGGTTGGYPRVAQVVRADRHLIGQASPGAPLRLLRWTPEHADGVLKEKTRLLRSWLGEDFSL